MLSTQNRSMQKKPLMITSSILVGNIMSMDGMGSGDVMKVTLVVLLLVLGMAVGHAHCCGHGHRHARNDGRRDEDGHGRFSGVDAGKSGDGVRSRLPVSGTRRPSPR